MKILVAVLFLIAVSGTASAHHSFAMFDETKDLVLIGTVKEVQWTNPHVWIQMEVADAQGKLVEWGIEATSPILLKRRGWQRDSLKPGDRITMICHPLRDGNPKGSFVKLTLANGVVLGNTELPPKSAALQLFRRS